MSNNKTSNLSEEESIPVIHYSSKSRDVAAQSVIPVASIFTENNPSMITEGCVGSVQEKMELQSSVSNTVLELELTKSVQTQTKLALSTELLDYKSETMSSSQKTLDTSFNNSRSQLPDSSKDMTSSTRTLQSSMRHKVITACNVHLINYCS